MSSDRTQTAGGPDTVVGQVAMAPRHEAPFEVGDEVAGRFVIVRFLGRGGMGEVYEAEDRELERRVAIKVLLAARFGAERAATLLRGEIGSARRVTHPSVCRVFDLTTHRDDRGRTIRLYSMELLHGETLADRIARRGRMTDDEARPIVRQLCAGLAAAHAAGVVHRDFKPHNVMLCGDRAVIVDFGLAIALEADETGSPAEVMGTPAYMAPEQLAGGAITRAVDIHALGVTLLDLVGESRWDAIIARCTARDPAQRPSLDEVVAALGDAPPARAGRRRTAIAAATVALVAGAGAAAFATMRGTDDGRPRIAQRFAGGTVARLVELHGPGNDKIESAVTDEHGDLYLAGHAGAGASIGASVLPTKGIEHGFVVKLGADDHLRWSRVFASGSKMSIAGVAVTGDRVVVGGYAGKGSLDLGDGVRTVETGAQALVVALSARDGRLLWSRIFSATGESLIRDLRVGPDGNVYVVGDGFGANDFGDGVVRTATPAVFVASYTPDGALRWVVAGTSGSNARGRVIAFAGDMVVIGGSAAGEVDFAGMQWTNGTVRCGFVAAFDRVSGRRRWVLPFSTPSETWGIALARDGSLRVAGAFAGRLELGPGQVVESPASRNRPFLASVDLASGRPTRVVALGGGEDASWGIRVLTALPDGRWFAAGGFDGDLVLRGRRVRSVGDVDGFLAIVDDDGTVAASTRVTGAGGERFRRATLLAPDRLAIWARHAGMVLGDTTFESAGIADGVYAEVRLEALFQ